MTGALPVARGGPLLSPWTILAIALVFIVAGVVAARPRPRARWPWLAPEIGALGGLALIHLLFFWQPYRTAALVPRGGGDIASFYYPQYVFAAGEIRAGRLPFWDPHLFGGLPHLANFQSATLYPPNLLAYLLARPFDYAALERLALAHYLLASYGAYWLARALGARRPGAALTGAIFAYSGFLVAHLGHYTMLATAAWLPWVLAAVVGATRRRSWALALWGVPALACMTLAGHQPLLLLGLTLAALVAIFELWRATGYAAPGELWANWRDNRPAVANVARLGVMAALAALIAAPALGPSFALTGKTIRAQLDYAGASEFSVEPVALLHLAAPTVFGSNPTDYWGAFSNTEIWGYAGVLAMLLAALAVAARASRTRVFWLLAGVAALLYVVGPFAALHGWAYAFAPGYDRIRAAGRAYVIFDLAVAVLAGFALDELLGRDAWSPRLRTALRWGLLGLAGLLAVVVCFIIPLLASRVLGVNDPGNRPVIALDNITLLALWLALGLGVALAAWRGALRGGALTVAVFAVVLLDLFHATAPFNPTTDNILAGYAHQDSVDFLRARYAADGPFRIEVVTPRWQPDLAAIAGLDDIGGAFDPLELRSYADYAARAVADRSSAAYRALNVRYIVSDDQSGAPAPGYREAYRAPDGIVIWEAPTWQPRAWLDGSDSALTTTLPDARSVVVRLPAGAPAATLVVSQTNAPGWRATVDGRPAPIATWDGALQQLSVPAGAREVRLTYAPEHWTLWLAAGIMGVVAWLAALAGTSVTRNRRRARRVVMPTATATATGAGEGAR